MAMLLFFVIGILKGQTINDYRTIASGNWTDVGIWQVFNGTSWVAATTYPGQTTVANDISIIGGFSVTITSNISNSINSVTVGDGTGGTDSFFVNNTSSLNTQLITIVNGGHAEWTANVTFSMPEGAAFVIESGGTLDDSRPCSASKRLVIGSAIYSTCNGGAGADYSFSELENSGGSLNVSPSSNSPICTNNTLTLFANPSGTGSGSATFSWNATGPLGYNFSSSEENPTVSALASGLYEFTVTATDGSHNRSGSTSVTVRGGCSVITNRRITFRVTPAVPVTATVPKGSLTSDLNIDYFDDGQNGSGNSYQLQIRNTTGTTFNYEIWIQNVPYSTIPGLTLGDHTVDVWNNGDGTFNYLFTSTSAIGTYQNRVVSGSGGAPSPLGSGIACGCISIYKM